MTTRRVLWVTSEPPNERLGGGSIRQSQLLRRIAAAPDVDVDLLVVGSDTDDLVRDAVDRVTELEVAPPARSGRVRRAAGLAGDLVVRRTTEGIAAQCRAAGPLAAEARRLEADYDVVLAQLEGLATAVPSPRSARWVLQMHHVPADRSAQRARHEPNARRRVRHRIEALNARRWTRRQLARWDLVVTVSREDARLLDLEAGRAVVAPNGVDLDRFVPTPRRSDGPVVLTASLDYHPNVDGATWFVKEVWPLVRRRDPARTLQLVGRSPGPAVLDLANEPGVSVHGDVPEIAPWLEAAAVAVVPLRIGTGTRLKALEAMAAGRPLVGTGVGLEGLGIVDGDHALVADTAAGLADALTEVLADAPLADALGAGGRALAERDFGWDRIAERYLAEVVRP